MIILGGEVIVYVKKDKILFCSIIYLLILSCIHFLIYDKPVEYFQGKDDGIFPKAVIKTYAKTKQEIESKSDEENNYVEVGNIKIENEDSFSSIIMQASDNTFYLNHDRYGRKNVFGETFLDYRTNEKSKILILYGHNSKNVRLPFKIFESYYSKDYYNSHKFIDLEIKKEKRRYEIFSVFVETENWDYLDISFPTKKSYYDHLYNLSKKSIYNTGYEVSGDEEVLIVQTCSTKKEYQGFDRKFLLVISRRVK